MTCRQIDWFRKRAPNAAYEEMRYMDLIDMRELCNAGHDVRRTL